jgi:DNA repair photolyase
MELFEEPINSSQARSQTLVGLGKIAAESPLALRKQAAQYFHLASKRVLNRCRSEGVPFTWTINPYRGCEFGCQYCYARYTHEYMGFESPAEFEEKIYSKDRAGEILRSELAKDPAGMIAIGTATDPYQPAERLFETTRAILETLRDFRGLRLSITTKSDLIRRDISLLREIALGNELRINMTVTTLDAALARRLEPRAPRPDLRLAAVADIAQTGIPVGVFAMPVLPLITDNPRDLEAIAREAARAGACTFAANVLFLMPSARKQFFPFLETEFPQLVPKYLKLYARSPYLRGSYAEHISALSTHLRRKYGLTGRPSELPARHFGPVNQLPLFSESQPPAKVPARVAPGRSDPLVRIGLPPS